MIATVAPVSRAFIRSGREIVSRPTPRSSTATPTPLSITSSVTAPSLTALLVRPDVASGLESKTARLGTTGHIRPIRPLQYYHNAMHITRIPINLCRTYSGSSWSFVT